MLPAEQLLSPSRAMPSSRPLVQRFFDVRRKLGQLVLAGGSAKGITIVRLGRPCCRAGQLGAKIPDTTAGKQAKSEVRKNRYSDQPCSVL